VFERLKWAAEIRPKFLVFATQCKRPGLYVRGCQAAVRQPIAIAAMAQPFFSRRTGTISGVFALLAMPRFYFDVTEDDQFAIDDTGEDMPGEEVGAAAASTLAEIAFDAIRRCPRSVTLAIDVRDANGPVLKARLDFRMEEPG
jgi:hypothetical protein